MTTALATQNRQELMLLLQEQGLQLVLDRPAIKMVQDSVRGRRLEMQDYPALNDSEAQAVRTYANTLQTALQPGIRAEIIGHLARLAAHRKSDRSPQEWQMLFEDYAEDLGQFSGAHVAESIREHRQSSNFYPSIAELRSRCIELTQRDTYRLQRAKQILGSQA